MSFLLEMLPLIGLGLGYLLGKSINPDEAIYFLAYGAIIGTLIQFAIFKLKKQKIQTMTLVTGVILIGFSIITIALRNPIFVYMKPTVVAWLFAIGFYIYPKIKGKTVLELMMGSQFELPKAKWHTLNWAWIGFNVILGAVNLYIALHVYRELMSTDVWVNFKLWGFTSATLVFVAGQTFYMVKNGKAIGDKVPKNEQEM